MQLNVSWLATLVFPEEPEGALDGQETIIGDPVTGVSVTTHVPFAPVGLGIGVGKVPERVGVK